MTRDSVVTRVRTSGGLTAREKAELVAWKVRLRCRHVIDRRGAYSRFTESADRWVNDWKAAVSADPSALRQWLTRADGGEFWFPVEHAADWARSTCAPADVYIAEQAVRGEFELLGTNAGHAHADRSAQHAETTPSWRRDLYTGYEWPLTDAFAFSIQRGDGSDIRTVWEMSRCYHFLPLARAYWTTGDARFATTFVHHVDSWLEQNPIGFGPNWACPMDVALRAANWVVALALFADAADIPPEFWQRLLANLYATGLFLERYPEWHPAYRGNHYVADAVGLVYLGALFKDDTAGARWLQLGSDTLTAEIQRQVGADGVSFEASLAYHRLVTELFTYGGDIVRKNAPTRWSSVCEERLRLMYRFIDAYLPPNGDAPMLGDADDGRLHAVSAESLRSPRKHRLGLSSQFWTASEPAAAAFPQGGYYVMRARKDHLIVRCGRVGLHGAGCHDHNDQLSYELTLEGRRIVADSGSYAYTRDLSARHAFRSTAAHSVVQLGGEEQNPITPERPWRVLADRTRSECTRWEVAPDVQVFEGRHFGYAERASRSIISRTIIGDIAQHRWRVIDDVEGDGAEDLTWRLHLAACSVVRCDDPRKFILRGSPAVAIRVEAPPELTLSLSETDASDRYGIRYRRPCLLLTGKVQLPVSIKVSFSVEE